MSLDSSARYSGAWQEISARIQARDRVLLAFIALTSALVGVALTNEDLALVGVAIGYAALATALLTRHHDLIIGYLGAFMAEIAEAETVPPNQEWMSSRYYTNALAARGIRDIAQLVFIGLGAVAGLSVAASGLAGSPTSLPMILWYGSVACSLLSLGIVFWTKRDRQALVR